MSLDNLSDLPRIPNSRLFEWVQGGQKRYLSLEGVRGLWQNHQEQVKFLSYVGERVGASAKRNVVYIEPADGENYLCHFRSDRGEEQFKFTRDNFVDRALPEHIRVHELTARTFREKKIRTKVTEALHWFFSLLISPFSRLYDMLRGDYTHDFVAALPGGNIEHDRAAQLNADTILPQLRFAADLFEAADKHEYGAEDDKSGAQHVGAILREGYRIGKRWRSALKESKRECDAAVDDAVSWVSAQALAVVPYGVGQGQDYVQHFLVFNSVDSTVDDICLSTPKVAAGHIFSRTRYHYDPESLAKWMKVLFYAQSVESKEAKEARSLAGPLHPKESLEAILREMNGDREIHQSHQHLPSRDPVKLLYALVRGMEVQESAFPQVELDPFALTQIMESKVSFYSRYLESLVFFYEEREGKLSKKEKLRVLESIHVYAEKVRHYLQSSTGDVAAEKAVVSLKEQVGKKIEALEAGSNAEKKIKEQLNETATPSRLLFNKPVVGASVQRGRRAQGGVGVGIRVRVADREAIERLRDGFARNRGIEQLNEIKRLLGCGASYLERGDLPSAYSLHFHLLRVLPPPGHLFWRCWNALQEAKDCLNVLGELAERCFESATGLEAALEPRDSSEFNVKLPLIMRDVYGGTMAFGSHVQDFQAHIDAKVSAVSDEAIVAQIREDVERQKEEIAKEAKRELKEDWDRRDAKANGVLTRLRRALTLNEERAAELQRQYAAYLAEKERREQKLRDKIVEATENNAFLAWCKRNFLDEGAAPKIRLSTLLIELPRALMEENGNRFSREFVEMGRLARLVGMEKRFLAYALSHVQGVKATYGALNPRLTLRINDLSQVCNSSPEWQAMMEECTKFVGSLPAHEEDSEQWLFEVKTKKTASFLIGLAGDWSLSERASAHEEAFERKNNLVSQSHLGFTDDSCDYLATPELALLRKQTAMMMLLENPGPVMKRYYATRVQRVRGAVERQFPGEEASRRYLAREGRLFLKFGQTHNEWYPEHTFFLAHDQESAEGDYCVSAATVYSAQTFLRREDLTERREAYFGGAVTGSKVSTSVVGDGEQRAHIVSMKASLFKVSDRLQPPEELTVRSTALCSSRLPDRFSHLSAKQVFIYIYENPGVVVESESIRQLLFNRIFQIHVLSDALLADPEFFVDMGARIQGELSEYFRKRDVEGELANLWLLDICERVRKEALRQCADSRCEELRRVVRALPSYTKHFIEGRFGEFSQTACQKAFALHMLAYYLDHPPMDISEWRRAIEAAYYLKRSPVLGVHTGLQLQYLRDYSETLLPQFARINAHLQQAVLRSLVEGAPDELFVEDAEIPFLYRAEERNIDLQTLEGVTAFSITDGRRTLLPEKIKALMKEQGCDLFEEIGFVEEVKGEVAAEERASAAVVTRYLWESTRSEGTAFVVEHTIYPAGENGITEERMRIFQEVRGVRYEFNNPGLASSRMQEILSFFSTSSNCTLEKLLEAKGVWVSSNKEVILLAQERQDLNPNKEPIRLHCSGKRVIKATLGEHIICSGLEDPRKTLLPFRDTSELLLLSKNGKRIDQIRFPKKGVQRALTLVRERNDEWWVRELPGWKWNQKGSPVLEERFGKDHRDYVLPLICETTGQEEWYVFPYLIAGGGKRGAEPRLLRSLPEILAEGGFSLESVLDGIENENMPFSAQDVMGMAGAAIQFVGGRAHEMARRAASMSGNPEASGNVDTAIEILSEIHSPAPVVMTKDSKGISSSHAGFLYLAMKAAVCKNYKLANHYIWEMLSPRAKTATEDELKQLKSMVIRYFSVVFINRERPKSVSEIAFMLRTFSAIFTVGESLSAQFKRSLLGTLFTELIPGAEVPEEISQNATVESIIKLMTSVLYGLYQKAAASEKGLAKLKSDDLILTATEERALGVHILLSSVVYSGQEVLNAFLAANQGDRVPEPVMKLLKAFVGLEIPCAVKVPRFDPPSAEEVRDMALEMVKCRERATFTSIRQLHERKGAEPTWETVLAHFLVYYAEICERDNLTIEELAPLFGTLPESLPKRKHVDVARRLLLLHFKTRKLRDAHEAWKCKGLQGHWKHLSLEGERQANQRYFGRKFNQNPTFAGMALYQGYMAFVAARKKVVELAAHVEWSKVPTLFCRCRRDGFDRAISDTGRDLEEIRTPEEAFLQLVEGMLVPLVRDQTEKLTLGPSDQEPSPVVSNDLQEPVRIQRREEIIDQKYFEIRALIHRLISLPSQLRRYVRENFPGRAALERLPFGPRLIARVEEALNGMGEDIDADALIEQVDGTFGKIVKASLRGYMEHTDEERANKQIENLSGLLCENGEVLFALAQVNYFLKFRFENLLPEGTSYIRQGARWAAERLAQQVGIPQSGADFVRGFVLDRLPTDLQPLVDKILQMSQEQAELSTGTLIGDWILDGFSTARRSFNPQLVEKREELKEDFSSNPPPRQLPALQFAFDHFFENAPTDLDRRADKAIAEVLFNPPPKSEMEKHHLESVARGVRQSVPGLKARTTTQIKREGLSDFKREVAAQLQHSKTESKYLRSQLLRFAKQHQEALDITFFFVGRKHADKEQILKTLLLRYEEGTLNIFGNQEMHDEAVSLITEFLYAATEVQQLEKAAHWIASLDASQTAQSHRAISQRIFEALSGGTNRLRYRKDDRTFEDSMLGRHYLLFDYRNGFISREKAREVAEAILLGSEKELHIAIMGTGKTSFIAPLVASELVRLGKLPVCVTTKELVRQLKDSLGARAYFFEFDLDCGLSEESLREQSLEKHRTLCRINTEDMTVEEINDHLITCRRVPSVTEAGSKIKHLKRIIHTLEKLSAQGRYIVTTPENLALLRNKCILLQEQIGKLPPGDERSSLFALLECVKRIECYFHREEIVYIPDEDVNLAINLDYNVAQGEMARLNPVRIDAAEKIMLTILRNPHLRDLREKLLANNLRSIPNIKEALRPLAVELVRDVEYWEDVVGFEGWGELTDAMNAEQFVAYLLGELPQPPSSLPAMRPDAELTQRHLCILTAMRDYLSVTFESVAAINPDLGRGILSRDGITPAPREDGEERPKVLYATELEYILHGLFHYVCGNPGMSETMYNLIHKDWFDDEGRISPNSTLTKAQFCKQVMDATGAVRGTKLRPFQAFSGEGNHSSKTLPKEERDALRCLCAELRLFYFRTLAENHLPVYHKQVTCNSQDIYLGSACHLLSGTGDAFCLNLSTPETWDNQRADLIAGETINSINLESCVIEFGLPDDHIKEQIKDFDCKAILNQDYALKYACPQKLIQDWRQEGVGVERQFIYRHPKTREKMILNPGALEPVPYSIDLIDQERSLFLFMPPDRRGVDMAVPQKAGYYASAMVGVGIDGDTHDQLLWRMRQLGTGQSVKYAVDAKTARRIRDFFSDPSLRIQSKHVIRYLHYNTVEKKILNRTKAVIFEAQKALKLAYTPVLREPYDIERFMGDDSESDAVLTALRMSGQFQSPYPERFPICEAFESVLLDPHIGEMIKEETINWPARFGTIEEVDRSRFLLNLYRNEIEKVELSRKKFTAGVRRFVNQYVKPEHRQAVIAAIFQDEPLDIKVVRPSPRGMIVTDYVEARKECIAYEFSLERVVEKSCALLRGYKRANIRLIQHEIVLGIIRYKELVAKAELTAGEIKEGEMLTLVLDDCIDSQRLQEKADLLNRYYAAHLTDKMRLSNQVDIGEEVHVEMHQEQEVKQELTEEEEQVEAQNTHKEPTQTHPLRLALFLRPQFNPMMRLYSPLSHRGCYISQRARALRSQIGEQGGFANFYILVGLIGSEYKSCIITPAEWEETLDVEVRSSHDRVSIYALTSSPFKRERPLQIGGSRARLTQRDEKATKLIDQFIYCKLYLGWTKFTPHEWDFLRDFILNLQDLHLKALLQSLPQISRNLLIKMRSPLEHEAYLLDRERFLYPEEERGGRQSLNALVRAQAKARLVQMDPNVQEVIEGPRLRLEARARLDGEL
ncbi:MAG: hypothetical protein H7A36_03335 [Chlamydiales bacterium]|nr:hypothetical protein [Chlamydiales bacterium]